MRLAWPPPWHLIASVLIPAIALAAVHLSPLSWQGSLSLAALILVIAIPGYLVTVWAFPGKSDLTVQRRGAICLAFSIILAGLFSLLLTATPRGLDFASLATVLSLLAVFLAGVAYLRWSDLPRNRRFFIRQKRGVRPRRAIARLPGLSWPTNNGRHAAMAVLILVACFAAAIAFGPYHALFGDTSDEKHFTEMQVTWPEALASSSAASVLGEELTAAVRIENHENIAMSYTLKLLFGNLSLFTRDLQIESEEIWQDQIAFELARGPAMQKREALYLMLYRDGDLTAPYKEERLWVNLSESDSKIKSIAAIVTENNSTPVNSTAANSIDVLENDSSPVIFSFGGGGGGGSGGGSSSAGSSKKTDTKQTASKTEESEKTSDTAAIKEVDESKDSSDVEDNASNLSTNDGQINLTSKANVTSESSMKSEDSSALKPNVTINNTEDSIYDNIDNIENSSDSPANDLATQELKAEGLTKYPDVEDESADNASIKTPIISSADQVEPIGESILSTAIDQPEIEDEIEPEETGNHLPKIKSLVPDKPSPQVQGTAIFWTAEATDDERDRVVYKFLLDGKEMKKWSKAGSWSWLTTGLDAGDYQITVLVRDGNHATEDSFDRIMNASFTLIPPNQPPVLKELKSDKTSPVNAGSMIAWTAMAVDPDDDAIYFKFMKNDLDATGWQTSNSWAWNTSSETPGDYTISVLVRDGLHASETSSDGSLESAFVLDQPNYGPEVTGLLADRNSPQPQGTVMTWTATATDAEGDEISYRFLVDDKPAGGWSLSDSWSWDTSEVMPGDHEIRVLARDGKHAPEDSFDGFKTAAFTVTGANNAPVLRSLVPNSTSPQAQGATVVWKAEAVDSDGDQIFYKFRLNGRDMNRWSESSTWKWTSAGQPVGDYRITVLARDGLHASEASFDSSLDATFSLVSEIDLQIAELMKKKGDHEA